MSSAATPRLLLGATCLDLPPRTTRDRALEVAGRFRESESLAVTLVKALDAGADAVYAVPSPTMRHALAELRRPVPVLARLPFVPAAEDLHYEHAFARDGDADGAGALGAGLGGLALVPAMMTGELSAAVAARCESGARWLAPRDRRGLAVAAGATDLALAADNAKFFERMLAWGRARFDGLAGFETGHLGLLVRRLHEWGVEPDFVLAAVNPRGWGMKPDTPGALAALRRDGIPVLATELRAGGVVPLAEGAEFAREHGAHGLVAELVDLDDVAAELRTLRDPAASES
ncbi:MAG: hypothetical protein U0704_18145 [Candidatus Eisenbacteria bacterium]